MPNFNKLIFEQVVQTTNKQNFKSINRQGFVSAVQPATASDAL